MMCKKKNKERKRRKKTLKRINNKYLMTAILATILTFTGILQSEIIPIVLSDIPVPPQASMTIFDPLDDLIYIYTGGPAVEYFDYVDVELIQLELRGEAPELGCTITVRAGPPVGLDNTIHYTLGFDENNDPEDNCPNYPTEDIDTTYTVIYTKAGGWTIERAKYQVLGDWWMVEDTNAGFGLASSEPGGFTIDIWIPLTELPSLTEILPWRVKTQTFTYPSTFPDTGDFVPDQGLAYLSDLPPEPWITEPLSGSVISYNITKLAMSEEGSLVGNATNEIRAVEMNDATDIEFALFEYSTDGENWIPIGTDYNSSYVWMAEWNFSELGEGRYYIRVTMKDAAGQIGKDQIQVYYDPTPPTPEIYEPLHDEIISEVIVFKAKTNDEDVIYMEIGFVYTLNNTGGWKEKDPKGKLGDLDQHKVGENAADGSNNFCAPTATANCLAYWDSYKDTNERRPFGNLYNENDPDGLKKMAKDLVNKMGTKKESGTLNIPDPRQPNRNNFEDGLKKYIKEKGYEGKLVVKSYHSNWLWREKVDGTGKVVERTTKFVYPTFEDFTNELMNDENVIVFINRNNKGHYMTGEAVNSATKKSKFRDPADGKITGEIELRKLQGRDSEKTVGGVKIKKINEGGVSQIKYRGEWWNVTSIWAISPNPNNSTWQDEELGYVPIGKDYEGYDGWAVEWDTTTVMDGWYLVKATMVDEFWNNGTDMIVVYVNNHPADINNDGRVDIRDITIAAMAFGSKPGDSNWNLIADLNEDEVIDIRDITIVALEFGRTA